MLSGCAELAAGNGRDASIGFPVGAAGAGASCDGMSVDEDCAREPMSGATAFLRPQTQAPPMNSSKKMFVANEQGLVVDELIKVPGICFAKFLSSPPSTSL
jgi:hypothetical protein